VEKAKQPLHPYSCLRSLYGALESPCDHMTHPPPPVQGRCPASPPPCPYPPPLSLR
jgi:hypothetical protein